jgi:intracellular multiplication protein IcmL
MSPSQRVQERNLTALYRYGLALKVAAGTSIALIISLAANVYLAGRPAKVVYFAQNANGGLTRIIPLEEPSSSDADVLQFAADAVRSVNSIDFANAEAQYQEAAKYFTRAGWDQFSNELRNSGTFDTIKKTSMVLSAAVSGAPVLDRQGIVNGVRFWDVQVPYRVRYRGEKTDNRYTLIAVVRIVRIPSNEHPRGIGIAQFVVKG